jgi:hypothetical protein
MSIQVISAVLNCRDPELTSSRRMVLVSLANYAGEDGHAWPSQKLVSEESGCGIRSLKDHLKWLEENGFIRRDTKNLGQGKGSRTSYYVDLKRLARTPPDANAQIAGANNARANSVSLGGGIPHFTNRQEPSLVTTDKSVVSAQATNPPESKSTGKVRSAARGKRIDPNWQPTPKDYAFASSHKLTREEINREADRFRNYWLAAAGRNAVKCDWEATWRNWLTGEHGIVTKRSAGQAVGTQPGGQSRGGGMVAAGLRAIRETRGYGEPVPEERDMGTGYDIDGDALRIAGSGKS